MKASETRELIEISISMAFGNTKRDNKKLHELCQLTHVELDELERLAMIGKATEKAYSKGAFLIYDVVENDDGTIERYNCDETIEELLGWLEFTESEERR